MLQHIQMLDLACFIRRSIPVRVKKYHIAYFRVKKIIFIVK